MLKKINPFLKKISDMKKIDNYISILLKLLDLNDSNLIISLQNTVSSDNDKKSLFFLPIRKIEKYIFSGICNGNNNETLYFLEKIQKYAKYILLDVEKKYPWMECSQSEKIYLGNIEGLVDKIIDHKKVINIWPNTITVEACISLVCNIKGPLSDTKLAVIGMGNIGFKLALRLVESGCKTSICSSDFNSTLLTARIIDQIKPKNTISSPTPFREIMPCVSDQDIIFVCTGSSLVIDEKIAKNLSENTKIFSLSNLKISDDVDKIFYEKNISFTIVDINQFYFLEVLKREIIQKSPKPKKNQINNLSLISNGYSGKSNNIVVDDADNPMVVLGHIDENGSFKRKIQLWSDFTKPN